MPAHAEPPTLPGLLEHAARSHGSAVAVSMREGLRTECWTYAELLGHVEAIAAWLARQEDLKAQDRVLVSMPNSPWAVATHLGLMRAGLVAVPLDLGSSAEFLERVGRKTGALHVIAGPAARAVPDLSTIDPAQFAALPPAAPPQDAPGPDDVAEIVFTSGTTGDPKGTVLSHANIVSNAIAASAVVPDRMPLRLLSILPLSHMLEQTVGLYLPMLKSGSVHYMTRIQPATVLREIRRQRVTGLVVVPRILEMLSRGIEQSIRQSGHWPWWERRTKLAEHVPIALRRHLFRPLHRQLGGELRFVLCGGAALPEAVAQWWERIGVHVIIGYGSTECAPVIASTTYDERPAGSVGWPLAGVEVKLAEAGEIWARGPNVARGYWQDAERSTAAFTADGWFRTGDIGELGNGGVLRITGRLGERIVLASGQKVFPADIEQELRKEAGIADCVVLALPDAAGHEKIHASLRLAAGFGADAAETAVRNANTRLANHQRILGHSVWATGDFPRTSLGKIRRSDILATLGAEPARPAARPVPDQTPPRESTQDQLHALLRRAARNREAVVGPDTELAGDLGLDSLAQVELLAAIEERLGIALDEEQLSAARTVSDLETLVEAGARAGSSDGPSEWPLGTIAGALRPMLQSTLLFPPHRLLARPFTVEGLEQLAGLRGPMLFAANHSSHVDTVSVLRALPREIRRTTVVAAASDYFYRNRLAGAAASLLLNTFPFSRAGGVRASLERCGELADRKLSILIYPEGTRSPDGSVLPFRSGIGLLARGLGIPVVPVAVAGGDIILPKGARWPRPGAVRVAFGAPQHVDAAADPEETARRLHVSVVTLLKGNPDDAR
ncbi:AMP-binding protein [Aestuariivirga sp.]|uniref:AMP-binding protein n=1 Tax=Aestuariivirga sp. TaxID=2650926 RepID=UPI00391AD67F